MILYRPVGMKELHLIFEANMRSYPARLFGQPIFYPVLNFEYAEKIAKDWNTKVIPFAGYVTRFEVDDEYVTRFERKVVGASWHEELLVSANELKTFNAHICPPIVVEEAYFGDKFKGYIPERFGFEGKDAVAQFIMLAKIMDYAPMDFYLEIATNRLAVYLNYGYWLKYDFSDDELGGENKNEVVKKVEKAWSLAIPDISLPISPNRH